MYTSCIIKFVIYYMSYDKQSSPGIKRKRKIQEGNKNKKNRKEKITNITIRILWKKIRNGKEISYISELNSKKKKNNNQGMLLI